MNFLFESKYKYRFNSPVETIRLSMNRIFSIPWYERRSNMIGRFREDNKFSIEPAVSIKARFLGTLQHLAIITGQLFSKEEKTSIHITIRPPYIVVITYYILLIILLFQLAGLRTSTEPEPWIVPSIILLILLSLYWLIRGAKKRMRKRFEQAMHIRSDQ